MPKMKLCCDNLIHPFQNDSGVSQRQRVVEDLLSGSAKIDGRTTAELLEYFTQLARHINYYDSHLNVSDWRPFFRESIPFSLASIITYKKESAQEKLERYNRLFRKRPNRQGLQLIIHFIYHQVISKMNVWHKQVKGSELPVESVMEKLIKDKLAAPVKKFMCLTNVAVQRYGIRRIDFGKLGENEVWNFTSKDLRDTVSFISSASTKRKQLIALHQDITGLFAGFLNIIGVTADAAELSIEKSLVPLKEELQKKHTPHLALLFAFLKLFQYLQQDLNGFTRKHLDFFYKEVLKLKPKAATPDKAHILFEIQKHLQAYQLKKDLQVKDGKDNNKAEIYFSLNDEIVVNKAEVAEVRTLFLNTKLIYDPKDKVNKSYVEGMYVAKDARKADGAEKEFADGAPKNWPTLGRKLSKYIDAEYKYDKPYSNARLGFILASPVLFLQEGTRTVDIQLACELREDICKDTLEITNKSTKCCDQTEESPIPKDDRCRKEGTGQLVLDTSLKDKLNDKLKATYYYISQELISKAIKKGVGEDVIKKLFDFLLITEPATGQEPKLCYCPVQKYKYDTLVSDTVFTIPSKGGFAPSQIETLADIFKPIRALNIVMSGEKDWIEPEIKSLAIVPMIGGGFMFNISLKLDYSKPAVTFFDKEKLKEDYDTEWPVVKVEIDDRVKFHLENELQDMIGRSGETQKKCCLSNDSSLSENYISLYHFFRNMVVKKQTLHQTKINVSVCGLKNFIVQNDESVMDVNGPVYPFGARPKVIDFDINKPPVVPSNPNDPMPNIVGPNFYIGSKEIFCKKWDQVYINLNWKDKPTDFREYYKAYWVDVNNKTNFGLDKKKFEMNVALLEDGNWKTEISYAGPDAAKNNVVQNPISKDFNRQLFRAEPGATSCADSKTFEQTIYVAKEYIDKITSKFRLGKENLGKYSVDATNGFLRINLQNQDFLHKDYAFVLARQMMAFGKLPDGHVESAVYYDSTIPGGGPIVISTTNMLMALTNAGPIASLINSDVKQIDALAGTSTPAHDINPGGSKAIRNILRDPNTPNVDDLSLNEAAKNLDTTINQNVIKVLEKLKDYAAIIPNEPWTPVIKNLTLDYTAQATIEDIDLIHLYPYTGTYRNENIQSQPTLFPTFCDEGSLFIGLKNLVPGNNLNILFQLAEATADSESEREALQWHYLDNNQWKSLRRGFEIIEDATDGLTTSGIVKLALPENMTNENTILTKGLHWIKASMIRNSKSVSETIGIHTQAIQVVFTNDTENDKLRLDNPLRAESISKLRDADANVKTVAQPYESFGGREPEAEKNYYVRVSELLRHKGRAIQKWDYERITLEAFPQIYKAKCINHSFALNASEYKNDFPMSPGYVLLAVIPDLTKVNAGNSFEPKVPISALQSIAEYLQKRISPFVRLRVMNPRYEKIRFCLKAKLKKGRDENYYKEKLEQDLREFLAPWTVGEYSKLSFGQCINRSDLLRFLEGLDYLDYILELKMQHETEDKKRINGSLQEICPRTPRSILIAGDIDVCINQKDCEKWDEQIKCIHIPDLIHNYR